VKSVPLVMDSSALLRDPKREKEATKALERLVAQGQVSLQLPHVVVREVISNLKGAANVELLKLEGAINSLERRVPSTVLQEHRESLRAAVHHLSQDLSQSIEEDFLAWLAAMHSTILPIAPEAGSKIMQAYFEGDPPFRAARQRDDIPDAFILDAIRDVAGLGFLHAVISDQRLAETVRSLQDPTVYASLDDFIASSAIQAALRRLAGTANLELLRRIAMEEPELLEEDISTDYIDQLAGETLYSPWIVGDNSEATISMVDELEDLAFDWSAAEYYGDGSVSVPFSFKTDVYADSYIYKSDFYAMSDEAAEDLSITDWNDHYYQAEAEYPVEVSGRATMTLPLDLSAAPLTREALAEIVPEGHLKIDSIDNIDVLTEDSP
jgi:hypothetical protein